MHVRKGEQAKIWREAANSKQGIAEKTRMTFSEGLNTFQRQFRQFGSRAEVSRVPESELFL
jgi:hypothetical protein